MSKIFINITNKSVQIDSFSCSLEEFLKVEKTFTVPNNTTELECNTDLNQRQCLKDTQGVALGMTAELRERLLGYVKNISDYKNALALPSPSQEQVLNELKISIINELESKRKLLQYANMPYKDTFLSGTEKARDNLFKATVQAKDKGLKDMRWLSTANQPIILLIDDCDNIQDLFLARDQALYFKEAELKNIIGDCTSIDEVLDKKGSFNFTELKTLL